MAGLVEQLQADALDPSTPTATLLRKVKLAAVKLGLRDVAAWVDSELSGYSSELPEYRILHGTPKALNPYRGWIPMGGHPDVMDTLSTVRLPQGIAQIESLVVAGKSEVFSPYNAGQMQAIRNMFDGGDMIGQAGVWVPTNQLISILDQVRNRVLEWAIELEQRGITGNGLSFSSEERHKAGGSHIHIENFSGSLVHGDLSGNNARVLHSSHDHSSNTVNAAFPFSDLIKVLNSVDDRSDRESLIRAVKKMERQQPATKAFVLSYREFIARAADYMSLIGPFLPGLTAMLGAS